MLDSGFLSDYLLFPSRGFASADAPTNKNETRKANAAVNSDIAPNASQFARLSDFNYGFSIGEECVRGQGTLQCAGRLPDRLVV